MTRAWHGWGRVTPMTPGAAALPSWAALLRVGALLLAAAPGARSAPVEVEGPLAFNSYLLELPGKVRFTYYEDIDRDGLTDVLAVYGNSDPKRPPRDLAVFFQRKDGFAPRPDLRLRIPDEVAVIDLGDVEESVPGEELLLLDGTGVDWFPLVRPQPGTAAGSAAANAAAGTAAGTAADTAADTAVDTAADTAVGAPTDAGRDVAADTVVSAAADSAAGGPILARGTRLVAVDGLLAASDPENLRKYDFARPLDAATRATLFIPRTEGYRVFYPADDYAVGQDIPVRHVHRIGANSERSDRDQMEYRVRPAVIQLVDFDGDGRQDFAVAHLDEVAVHRQVDGRFTTAADLDLSLGILTNVDRESAQGVDSLIDFKLADFDGDKLADVFVWKTVVQKKAVINDKQQYQLYRNRGFRFEPVPDQAFVLKSFDAATIADLDGNGKLDLVTGYFEFSVANIIKALLSKKFAIDLSFFLADEHGFPDRPAETREFKIRFSLSNLDETFAPAVDVEDDFDGNGVVDFLLQTDDQRVDIFLGSAGGPHLFEQKASVRLQTPACERHHAADMNGDGRADLAFDSFPDRAPFKPGWINIVLSSGAPARPPVPQPR